MRKSGLPVLKIHFPDGTEQPLEYLLSTNNVQITTTDLAKHRRVNEVQML
jgi:hypothetical protein